VINNKYPPKVFVRFKLHW